MPELASSDACLTLSSNGSDVANDGRPRKCVLGWSDELRASAEFPNAGHVSSVQGVPGPAAMPQSARRWNGLPSPSPSSSARLGR